MLRRYLEERRIARKRQLGTLSNDSRILLVDRPHAKGGRPRPCAASTRRGYVDTGGVQIGVQIGVQFARIAWWKRPAAGPSPARFPSTEPAR